MLSARPFTHLIPCTVRGEEGRDATRLLLASRCHRFLSRCDVLVNFVGPISACSRSRVSRAVPAVSSAVLWTVGRGERDAVKVVCRRRRMGGVVLVVVILWLSVLRLLEQRVLR